MPLRKSSPPPKLRSGAPSAKRGATTRRRRGLAFTPLERLWTGVADLLGVGASGKSPNFQAVLAPRRLERRRMLDAGAAGVALTALETSLALETVQTTSDAGATADVAAASTNAAGELETPLPGGAADSAAAGPNTPPSNIQFAPLVDIDEDGVASLELVFDDPDASDAHTIKVDWRDGTPVETFNLPAGLAFFGTTHQYLDDSPSGTSSDQYQIKVTVADDQGGSTTAQSPITVHNVAPSNLEINVLPPVDENGVATLELTFDDPGTLDSHTVEVDWGDGSPLETFNLAVGARLFGTTHQYLDDNPTATTFDVNTVKVRVLDDDLGEVSASKPIVVFNIAPTNLKIDPIAGIDENGVATLKLSFDDPGTLDTHEVVVDWGDGSPVQTLAVPLGDRTFTTTHQYLDDQPGAVPDQYTVKVTLRDDDKGETLGQATVAVSNVAPTNLVLTPSAGTINEGQSVLLSVSFDDPGTLDGHTYEVDWGDGITSAGAVAGHSFAASHTYADNGAYTITVKVTDDDDGVGTASTSIIVQNVAPTLTVVGNQTFDEGQTFNLVDLGTFTDPGFNNPLNIKNPGNGGEVAETFTYSINWGDGTAVSTGAATIDTPGSVGTPTAGSFNGQHTYADNGVYTVTVTVADDDGGVSMAKTFTVTVNNVAPTLIVPANQSVNEGTQLSLVNIGQFTDPGFNNPLNTGDPFNGGETAETFTYSIDWGDGTAASAGAATVDTPGSVGTPTAGSFDGQHTYADNGVYTVKVTVADDDGGMTTKSFTVTVANVAPTLTVVGNQTVSEGSPLSLVNIGQFTDPGFNNPLNTGDPSNGGETAETFTYSINWGDGTAASAGAATVDTPGSPGTATAGSFDGQHTYADNGVYTVTVTVADDDGGMTSKSFTVTVNNVTPTLTVVANQTVNEGALLSLPNIGQFTDPGFDNPLNTGDPSNGGETVETFTYSINWGDGTAVSAGAATVDTPGSAGTPTAGSFDGQHTYADNGVYTVTVTVADDDGGTVQKTFTVTVNNVVPTLTVSPNQTVSEGALLSLPNIGQFTDPGFNNPLNAGNVSNGGETVETFTYSINWGDGTAVSAGNATVDTPGSPGTPTAGSFDGQHTYADNGVYTVTVTLSDDDGGTVQKIFTVTVNNVAPTLAVSPNQTVNEGTQLSLVNIGQFTDPGFNNPLNTGDPSNGGETAETFTYSINWGDGTAASVGAATIDTPGGVGMPTAGSFDGQHTYADNGVYTVTVTVADDDNGVTTKTFTVTVNNVAPALSVAGNQTVNEGALLSLPNIGQFTDPGFDNPLNTGDPSNGGETVETFTYSINWGDGTAVSAGAATVDTPGSAGTPTAGSFDGQHTYADNGVYTVTVTVADDDGGTVQKTFTVTVNNVVPTLTVSPNQTVNEGTQLSLVNIGQFTDPGFDNPLNAGNASNGGETVETFTYSINWGDGTAVSAGNATVDTPGSPGTPTAGSFDGQHTYADNGIYTVTVTLSDDDGGTVQKTFTVTVNNVAPALTIVPNQTTNEGSQLLLPNIGQFTDPGFDNPLNAGNAANGGETVETFTYSINWGDGTATDAGNATVDVPGSVGTATAGSFDGQHTYADNGVYTVTVTVADDDSGVTVKTFTVTVNNVAPTLAVSPNQTINEGSQLVLPNIGQFTDPGFNNPANAGNAANGGEFEETFTFTVNWGDGTAVSAGAATVDTPGSPGTPTAGSFDGQHTYADNGTYTVTVTVTDDDNGVTVKTFTVNVLNVDPTLTGTSGLAVNEGQAFTLVGLGVRITDPGFDNPANAGNVSNGGEIEETFTGVTVDWGDGHAPDALGVNNRVSGSVGTPTTADFVHSPHTYADNGNYTVKVRLSDDDGAVVERSFVIHVDNVAPTVSVVPTQRVHEGSNLVIVNVSQFTDPGFDNPLNTGDPSNGGETSETFTYTINWGDEARFQPGDDPFEQNGTPTTDVFGSPGTATAGSFDAQHTYVDNGVYTVTVTIRDDDGGVTVNTFLVDVHNVSPVLYDMQPGLKFNATDINTKGKTTITGSFTDPGRDTYKLFVDWGDNKGPHEVVNDSQNEVVISPADPTSGLHTFTATHRYTEPPDPLHPAADIPIAVQVHDDDFPFTAPLPPVEPVPLPPQPDDTGESNKVERELTNPGIGKSVFRIDTTPQVPALGFPPRPQADGQNDNARTQFDSTRGTDVRGAGGEAIVGSERYLELRVINPDGTQSAGYRLRPQVLANLPALFRNLPDNHYAIYLVQAETDSRRLVIEVFVRNGKLIDPGDDSEGGRDRPPTDDATNKTPAAVPAKPAADATGDQTRVERPAPVKQARTEPAPPAPLPEAPAMMPAAVAPVDDSASTEPSHRTARPSAATLGRRSALAGAALGLAAVHSSAAPGIDQTVAAARREQWRRLRSAGHWRRRSKG